ncbi:MAG: hypothetical protein ABIJ92_03455 [Candidatus Aenigmatarchaeota archaeon]
MKGQEAIGKVIIFFIVFIIIWILASWVFNNSQVGFIIGLFAGFILSGTGTFIWEHKTG